MVLELGLHLLLGEPQGTEGGWWAPSRHYREQRYWRAGTAGRRRRGRAFGVGAGLLPPPRGAVEGAPPGDSRASL